MGLIIQVSAEWSVDYTNDETSLMTSVGLSLVCTYLTKNIPELIGGIISATSMVGNAGIDESTRRNIGNIFILFRAGLCRTRDHSHSMVPGGFDVIS